MGKESGRCRPGRMLKVSSQHLPGMIEENPGKASVSMVGR